MFLSQGKIFVVGGHTGLEVELFDGRSWGLLEQPFPTAVYGASIAVFDSKVPPRAPSPSALSCAHGVRCAFSACGLLLCGDAVTHLKLLMYLMRPTHLMRRRC